MRPQTHMLKGRAETCQFPIGFEAWTGVTLLSAAVFGKECDMNTSACSASEVSCITATDANLTEIIIKSLVLIS